MENKKNMNIYITTSSIGEESSTSLEFDSSNKDDVDIVMKILGDMKERKQSLCDNCTCGQSKDEKDSDSHAKIPKFVKGGVIEPEKELIISNDILGKLLNSTFREAVCQYVINK